MLIFVSVMFITLSQDLLLCDHAKKKKNLGVRIIKESISHTTVCLFSHTVCKKT